MLLEAGRGMGNNNNNSVEVKYALDPMPNSLDVGTKCYNFGPGPGPPSHFSDKQNFSRHNFLS